MIDLTALKSYEETHIAHYPANSTIRLWWNALSFKEQCAISQGAADARDYQADQNTTKLNQETYGTNT